MYESAPEVKELGVGITLLPHAMREMAALGLGEALTRQGIENRESCFFNRFGQLIYAEPRGRFAGYPFPEVGLHRGRVHLTLWNAAVARLGAARILTDHQYVGLEQTDQRVTLHFRSGATGAARAPVEADVAIACDGVNSAVRRQFYPDEELRFVGINTWRGVTRAKPFLTGRSYVRAGSIHTGNIVIYPIIDDVDGDGNQLINWTTQVAQPGYDRNDWNKPGRLEDFHPHLCELEIRLARCARPDPPVGGHLRIPDGGPGPRRSLDFRPRDPPGGRRPSDVPARLERRGPGHPRRARARRPPGRGR